MDRLLFVLLLSSLSISLRAEPGEMDLQFDAIVDGPTYAIVIQPDGRVVIGGDFSTVGNVHRSRMARLNPDGSPDSTFDPGGSVGGDAPLILESLALQPDGKILVAGWFTKFDGVPRNGVARLNSDGTLDRSFDPGQYITGYNYGANAMAVQADGQILIGGHFQTTSGKPLMRVYADGTLDRAFIPAIIAAGGPAVTTLNLQPDGKLLIGGSFLVDSFLEDNFKLQFDFARLDPDGKADLSFSSDVQSGGNSISAIARTANGDILVAGDFTPAASFVRGNLARYSPSGIPDPAFLGRARPNEAIWCLALQTDGKIWVGGAFTAVDGLPRHHLARLSADGSVDRSVAPAGFGTVSALAWASPDRLIAAGRSFDLPNDLGRRNLVKVIAGEPVAAPPQIQSPPSSQTVLAGNNATFIVAALGYPLTCQWRKEGVPIPGATNLTLTLVRATAADAGAFALSISNALGAVTTEPAFLTVAPAPDGPNLVVNSGFEKLAPIVSEPNSSAFQGVIGWEAGPGLSPDVFASPWNVPQNYMGEQAPFEGTNYAGIQCHTFDEQFSTSTLRGTLSPATEPGQRYRLTTALCRSKLNSSLFSPLDIADSFPVPVEILLSDGSLHPRLVGRTTIEDDTNWTLFDQVLVAGKP